MILIDAGKIFVKIQHQFMKKISRYKNRKELHQSNKAIYNETKQKNQHHT